MMYHWKRLGFPSLLALAFAAAPGTAGDGGKPAEADQLDAIKKEMVKVNESLAGLKKVIEEYVKETNLNVAQAQADIKSLRDRVAALEELMQKMTASTRVSASPPSPAVGRIRLLNLYNTQMTILLNGKSYRLAPNQTEELRDQPAGAFTYEVLSVNAQPVTRTLAANETYTIFVYPR